MLETSADVDVNRPCADARTIPEALLRRVEASPRETAYIHHADGEWREISWEETAAKVARYCVALRGLSLPAGERVGLMMPNGPECVAIDFACLTLGLVTVPLYIRDSAANVAYLLRDSGARLCVVDAPERWASVAGLDEDLPDLEQVWLCGGASDTTARLRELDARVDRVPGISVPAPPLRDFLAEIRGDDLATLVYTSGTTGPPKGVMLSHGALLSNARAVDHVMPSRPEDLLLSILPLAHSFERSVGWLLPMLGGATVAYARSVETLAEDLQSLRPTAMLAVPRLFERVHARALAEVEGSTFRTWLLETTTRVGWKRWLAKQQGAQRPNLFERLFWALLGVRIARRVRGAFGGRTRVIMSGGAPLSFDTGRFMYAMEMPLIEGYGLTEAGPAVSGSTLADRRQGSVGFALQRVELSLGEADELLVRSPGLMTGYWRNEEATRTTIDAEGWLHTGDRAEFVDGHVFIKGRIKDILVLSTGENVSPDPIEAVLVSDRLITQACVLGDRRPWCIAVVAVDEVPFVVWAETKGLDSTVSDDPEIEAALLARLAPRMEAIPPFARIRALVVETSPWTPESGMITPTLKTKRAKITDRYSRRIEEKYANKVKRRAPADVAVRT